MGSKVLDVEIVTAPTLLWLRECETGLFSVSTVITLMPPTAVDTDD